MSEPEWLSASQCHRRYPHAAHARAVPLLAQPGGERVMCPGLGQAQALAADGERPAAANGPPGELSLNGFLMAVQEANDWLDNASDMAPAYRESPLAHTWVRVTKVCSEAGEAIDALSAMTGENPRKGVHGTEADLLEELGDVVSAGLLAIQHLTDNTTDTWRIACEAVQKVQVRAMVAQQSRGPR